MPEPRDPNLPYLVEDNASRWPNDLERHLNERAAEGWVLTSCYPAPDGGVRLIFERRLTAAQLALATATCSKAGCSHRAEVEAMIACLGGGTRVGRYCAECWENESDLGRSAIRQASRVDAVGRYVAKLGYCQSPGCKRWSFVKYIPAPKAEAIDLCQPCHEDARRLRPAPPSQAFPPESWSYQNGGLL